MQVEQTNGRKCATEKVHSFVKATKSIYGLGLAISKEIIEHHNVEIVLNTINHNYHTLWFTLPLYKEI